MTGDTVARAADAWRIRRYRPGEEEALWDIYHSAIHLVAARDYTAEQRQAWASAQPDLDQWRARIAGINPYVVEGVDTLLGYADLQPTGYIDHFFVSGHHPRQGIGTQLMDHLQAEARLLGIPALSSNVSLTAEPFFVRHGFVVLVRQTVLVRGVHLANARMRKILSPTAS